jgi:hypothetical protein
MAEEKRAKGREVYTPAQFASALERSALRSVKETVKVTRKGANNIKVGARRNVRQTAPVHNAGAQNFINWDVEAQGVEVVGEVGYDRTMKPARLGNLLEFGGSGDKSPPHSDLARALEAEDDRYVEALADMAESVIW